MIQIQYPEELIVFVSSRNCVVAELERSVPSPQKLTNIPYPAAVRPY
jgi:hypothetical protein